MLGLANDTKVLAIICPKKEAANLGKNTREKSKMNGILLPKLFWPTVRKNCSSDQEKLLKFEAEGREFAKILRSLEQFVGTVKGQNNFWQQNAFLTWVPGGFSHLIN